ncbi:hypothetical protein KXD93_12500 [Mucilaginibacter sp. BJC16-A38]|uniref:hypothetical protein n=1 Tax=Mucilaginibacter phenanthrenivorans TaxID=1234842 RepID=UPI002157B874|nr:hypothetical protein [Mucilaginibacter phenanthrenivorans]MCR8558468.1 hypothetical protein [Mucilaginibacter phenanthrenivorans]
MKLNFTRILLLATIVIALYASCKKSETQLAPKTATDYDTVSKHIAINLMRGLAGEYGGTNINNGIKSQSNVTVGHDANHPVKNVLLCGFTIDTTYNSTVKVKDTSKTFLGRYKFVYTCTTVRPDGYTVHDSLVTLATSPQTKNNFTVTQDYSVKALDTTYKLISTNGSIQFVTNNMLYRNGFSEGYNYYSNTYKLNALKIDFSSGAADIIGGVTEFESSSSYLHPGDTVAAEVTISGTIQFLGNHKAKLTIKQQNKSFMVDLTTGASTII